MSDMFDGLGSQTPGGAPKLPFLRGLGKYALEVAKFRAWPSDNPATKGHSMVKLEVIVREVIAPVTPEEASDIYLTQEGSHAVGDAVVCLWNLTKNPYGLKDIRGLVDGLVPVLAEKLDDAEIAALDEEDDQHAAIARLASAGDGTRFAGAIIGATVSPDSKNPQYQRLFFEDIESAKRTA